MELCDLREDDGHIYATEFLNSCMITDLEVFDECIQKRLSI